MWIIETFIIDGGTNEHNKYGAFQNRKRASLGSRRLCTLLGLVGLFYGMIGVLYLHIGLDWALILGSCILLFYSMRRNWDIRPRSIV